MTKIPEHIINLFWEWDKSTIDINLHKRSIIEKVINYGSLSDWKWLVSLYGLSDVRKTALQTNNLARGNINFKTKKLAELILKSK